MTALRDARSALWHLRRGGVAQLRQWQRRRAADAGRFTPANIRGAEGGWKGLGRRRRLTFTSFDAPNLEPRRSDLRVGTILDDFSGAAFGFEWNSLALSRTHWRDQLTSTAVDFIFVESAWNGNGGDWKYQLTGENGPKPEFSALMAWCRENGVPTVFWNKEDPPHFRDFLESARLFDVVFTSDANKIQDYVAELGHDRVAVLPFAAQPALHNPVRPGHGHHSRDVAFAGMYFAHKYPERRAQMDMLLGGAADAALMHGVGFEIFSRQLGGDVNYQFPDHFRSQVVGSLSYPQMLTAYRSYKVFLNVNSVVDSPSMCARRIFEITASGTPVLTSPSEAIGNYFAADEVVVAGTRAEAAAQIRTLVANADLRDRVVHKAQRRIWNGHTYAHRAEAVIAAAVPAASKPAALPTISALVSTFRPGQLESIFATVGVQQNVDTELVLLTHGFEVADDKLVSL